MGSRSFRPIRQCLGCRERVAQDELVRLQLTQTGVAIVEHPDQRRSGRSVYCCPKLGCFDKLVRRREIVFKRSKYDKIIVCLTPKQVDRLRYAFKHAARRLRADLGVGPKDN